MSFRNYAAAARQYDDACDCCNHDPRPVRDPEAERAPRALADTGARQADPFDLQDRLSLTLAQHRAMVRAFGADWDAELPF